VGAAKVIVPFYTFIIQLGDGFVSGLTWDDGCYGCEGNSEETCVADADGNAMGCAIAEAKCSQTNADTQLPEVDCDLKMYLGWFGTDVLGNYLTSAGKRLSRFRGASLKGAFDTAVNGAVSLYQDIKADLAPKAPAAGDSAIRAPSVSDMTINTPTTAPKGRY
jgi:hypothetical protein